jgi:uncharacterized protein YyaL (SSP411 family)
LNRLASEKSPYLLQHASNPVDWYPWGDEAFDAARSAGKPIFLSVGYSTCHWCHVMAHESFEDAGVAAVLNEHFISIKVDREERPDVDRIYMAFVQATTGSGGWPMSAWLLPDRRPFYGGTYFPPASAWGRPGFVDLLREMARLWRDERGRVEAAAAGVTEHLAASAGQVGALQVPGAIALDGATRDLLASYDRRNGGFGGAPKFPRPSELLFLLTEHRRTGDRKLLDVVAHTLTAMAAGGMRDQLGGGFHRYSVDARWRVPHFEKMLYDQAQLVLAYLEAAQATGDRGFVDVAEDTLRYVQRDLTSREGAFFSAEDADSLPPGAPPGAHATEGAFYLWSVDEIERLLGPDAQMFCDRFGVERDGNALSDPQGEFKGRNILYEARPIDAIAGETDQTVDAVADALGRSRQALLRARNARPRPQLDDKILTAWNGLTIGAFARGGRLIGAPGADGRLAAGDSPLAAESRSHEYLEAARRAASFIRARMWDPATGRLCRRYRDGEAAIDAFAEDYACLIFGLLELCQAVGDRSWLDWAVELQRRQDALFWDGEAGGWFSTDGRDPTILWRFKDDYDGAEPAASSVSVHNLQTLVRLGAAQDDAREKIERTLKLFSSRLTTMGRAVPMMMAALSSWHASG